MNKKIAITKTVDFIKNRFSGESSGHDWWHVYRVWRNAVYIEKFEKADLFVIELASLLHDLDDWKFSDKQPNHDPQQARRWLEQLEVDKTTIVHVCQIISDISFKGAGVTSKMNSIEGKIVQDADRLDTIGAIGIGRAFAYGGAIGRIMYDPTIKPTRHHSFEQYQLNQSHTINHFYEKLLLLKDLMNTATAKKLPKEGTK